jgi:hypothetical protein
MIVGDGARFDYLVDVLVNLDLDVVKFLCRFQYGLYVIIFLLDTVYLNSCFLTRSTMKKWSLCGNSFCFRRFPTVIGHVKVDTAEEYIPVIKKGHFYCSFGTSMASTRILVCKLYKKKLF